MDRGANCSVNAAIPATDIYGGTRHFHIRKPLANALLQVLLTTPMFKWPDPPEGKIIIKLPFTIYWAVSGTVTGLLLCVSAPLLFRFEEWQWRFWRIRVSFRTTKEQPAKGQVAAFF